MWCGLACSRCISPPSGHPAAGIPRRRCGHSHWRTQCVRSMHSHLHTQHAQASRMSHHIGAGGQMHGHLETCNPSRGGLHVGYLSWKRGWHQMSCCSHARCNLGSAHLCERSVSRSCGGWLRCLWRRHVSCGWSADGCILLRSRLCWRWRRLVNLCCRGWRCGPRWWWRLQVAQHGWPRKVACTQPLACWHEDAACRRLKNRHAVPGLDGFPAYTASIVPAQQNNRLWRGPCCQCHDVLLSVTRWHRGSLSSLPGAPCAILVKPPCQATPSSLRAGRPRVPELAVLAAGSPPARPPRRSSLPPSVDWSSLHPPRSCDGKRH